MSKKNQKVASTPVAPVTPAPAPAPMPTPSANGRDALLASLSRLDDATLAKLAAQAEAERIANARESVRESYRELICRNRHWPDDETVNDLIVAELAKLRIEVEMSPGKVATEIPSPLGRLAFRDFNSMWTSTREVLMTLSRIGMLR